MSDEMSTAEFQEMIDGFGLLDSFSAASLLNVTPGAMRNPNGKYKKYGIKIGQYWFWRRRDLKMFLAPAYNSVEDAERDGWKFLSGKKLLDVRDGGYYLGHIRRQGKKICFVTGNSSLWTNGNIAGVLGKCHEIFINDNRPNYHGRYKAAIRQDEFERIMATAHQDAIEIYQKYVPLTGKG